MSTDFIDLLKHKTTHTVVIGDDIEIPVELPVNPVQGLGGRDDLKVGTGMLFTMDRTQTITMRGMKFSLDIVWIGANNKVVDISANTLLSVLNNDSLYTPKKPAKYALEINAGEAQKRGINIDDTVQINLLPNDSSFTRLVVLEKALDYLFKAQPGERLEYLKPGEKPPKGAQLQRGARGGRGYYPSEVREAKEEADVLEAPEEQEIEAVQAPEAESTESVVSFEGTPPTDAKEIIAGLDEDEAHYAAHGKEFISYLLDQIESIREEVPSHKLQQLEVPFQRLQALEDQLAENKADLEPFYDAVLEYVDNTPWPVPIGSNRKKIYSELSLSIASDVYGTHGPNHPLLRKIIDDVITDEGLTDLGRGHGQNARIPHLGFLSTYMDMAPASLLKEWYGGYSEAWIQAAAHTQQTLRSYAEKGIGKPGPAIIHISEGAINTIGRRLRYQSELSDTVIEHFTSQVDTFLTSGLKEGEKLLPPLDEWPEDFKKRFQNLHATTNPSTTIVLAMDELYKSTKFGLFHSLSKEDWEQDSSRRYSGILKDAASRVLDGPIVFHRINVHDSEGNAAVIDSDIEEAYEDFSTEAHVIPKDFVDSYMQVQKQLTSELLEMAFPGVEEFELFRGVDDSNLHNEIDPREDEYDVWGADDEEDDEEGEDIKPWMAESEEYMNPDTPDIPEFDSVFRNVTGKLYENPIASWSLDYKAASTNFAEQKDYGVVLRRKVSRDDIWTSFLTHAYDGNEYEMVLIPNKNHFTVGAVFGSKEPEGGLDQGHDVRDDADSEGYKVDESLGVRGLEISDLFNPQARKGYEYRDFLQRIEHDDRVRALKQDINKADEDEVEDNDKKSKKINIEDNGNEDWIKEVRKKIEKETAEDSVQKSDDNQFTQLLALSLGLEYLRKQEAGKREYLAPGEKPPGGERVQQGSRGGRYYIPGGSVDSSNIREALRNIESPEYVAPDEEPSSEEEIEIVQAPDSDMATIVQKIENEEALTSEEIKLVEDWFQERGLEVPQNFQTAFGVMEDDAESGGADWNKHWYVNDYFEEIAIDLDASLRETVGPDYKPYLGREVSPFYLNEDYIDAAGYTDGSKTGVARASGIGINSSANFTVEIEGKHFVWKMESGENRAELLSYSVDRALGLNVVPYVKPYSMGADALSAIVEKTHGEPLHEYSHNLITEKGVGRTAGGHFQEFCDDCFGKADSIVAMADMLGKKSGRKEFFKIMLLDMIVGNNDRHQGNYLISKDYKIVAIDNGFAGPPIERAKGHTTEATVNLHRTNPSMMNFPYALTGMMLAKYGKEHVQNNLMNEDSLAVEAEALFDEYFDKDRIDGVLKTVNWTSTFGSGTEYSDVDIERFKHRYSNYAVEQLRNGMYDAYADQDAEVDDILNDDEINWNQTNQEPPFEDFIRDLKDEGGDADLFNVLDTAFRDSEDTPSDIRRMEEEVLERGRQNDKRLRRQYPKS